MKKIIFGLALVLSLGLLASCNNVYQVQDVNATVNSTIYGDVAGTVKYVETRTSQTGSATPEKTKDDAYTFALSEGTFGDTYLYISENPNSNATGYSFNNVYYTTIKEKLDDADEVTIDENGGLLTDNPVEYIYISFTKIGDKYYVNGSEPQEVTFTETDTGYTLTGKKTIVRVSDNGLEGEAKVVNTRTYETIYDITFTTK